MKWTFYTLASLLALASITACSSDSDSPNPLAEPAVIFQPSFVGKFAPREKARIAFKVKGEFRPGNQFGIQLSDSTASFSNPKFLVIDFVRISDSIRVDVFLPDYLSFSGKYRIRIISTLPERVSPPNAVDLTMAPPTINFATLVTRRYSIGGPTYPGGIFPGATVRFGLSTTGFYYGLGIITAEMSDSLGSFESFTSLGSIYDQFQNVRVQIPTSVKPGPAYRLRLRSAQYGLLSEPSEPFEMRYPTVNILPPTGAVHPGGYIEFEFSVTGSPLLETQSLMFELSDAQGEFIANTEPFETHNVSQAFGSYKLARYLRSDMTPGNRYRLRAVTRGEPTLMATTPFFTVLDTPEVRLSIHPAISRVYYTRPGNKGVCVYYSSNEIIGPISPQANLELVAQFTTTSGVQYNEVVRQKNITTSGTQILDFESTVWWPVGTVRFFSRLNNWITSNISASYPIVPTEAVGSSMSIEGSLTTHALKSHGTYANNQRLFLKYIGFASRAGISSVEFSFSLPLTNESLENQATTASASTDYDVLVMVRNPSTGTTERVRYAPSQSSFPATISGAGHGNLQGVIQAGPITFVKTDTNPLGPSSFTINSMSATLK